MHIPDGFIAPQVYLPLYAIAAGCWAYGIRRVRCQLNEQTLPHLAVMTGLAFVVMMVAVPLPGGTSAHASGIGLLAILFGVWTAFIACSLVFLLQALLFGDGGITSLPVIALAMGLAGAAAASLAFRGLRGIHQKAALITAGWLSVNLPALLVAAVLGLQPLIAHRHDGTPLFFPFGLDITVPALLIPHAMIGIGEGLLTAFVYQFFARLQEAAS